MITRSRVGAQAVSSGVGLTQVGFFGNGDEYRVGARAVSSGMATSLCSAHSPLLNRVGVGALVAARRASWMCNYPRSFCSPHGHKDPYALVPILDLP